MKINEVINFKNPCDILAHKTKLLQLMGNAGFTQPVEPQLARAFFDYMVKQIRTISPRAIVKVSPSLDSITWQAMFQNPATINKLYELADQVEQITTSVNGGWNDDLPAQSRGPSELGQLKDGLIWRQIIKSVDDSDNNLACDWSDVKVAKLKGTKSGNAIKMNEVISRREAERIYNTDIKNSEASVIPQRYIDSAPMSDSEFKKKVAERKKLTERLLEIMPRAIALASKNYQTIPSNIANFDYKSWIEDYTVHGDKRLRNTIEILERVINDINQFLKYPRRGVEHLNRLSEYISMAADERARRLAIYNRSRQQK